MAATVSRTGWVEEFDVHAGLGRVRDEASSDTLGFHCTAIVDGSREIDVGTEVRFDVVAGRSGRWEATRVEPILPG